MKPRLPVWPIVVLGALGTVLGALTVFLPQSAGSPSELIDLLNGTPAQHARGMRVVMRSLISAAIGLTVGGVLGYFIASRERHRNSDA